MTGITREQAQALLDGGIVDRGDLQDRAGNLARSLIAVLDERDAAEDRAKRADATLDDVEAWEARALHQNEVANAQIIRAETAEATATALTARIENLREGLACTVSPHGWEDAAAFHARLTAHNERILDADRAALKETPNA